MKLIALNLVFLAFFVKFGICSFSTFFSEYSLGNEDDYYNEYPGADYEVEKIPLAAVPRRPRGRLGGNRAYRQLFSPFARPAPSSSGFLSQFTTGRPTWTPYPGTLVTLQLLSQLQIVPILNIFFRIGVMNCNRPNCARLFRSFKFKPGQGKCK